MQHYLLTTLQICLLGVLGASSAEGTVFWVAPTLEQCGNRTAGTDEVQCNTLKGYQKNSSIFSTSHSKWVFLKGEHYMAYSPIIVSGGTNITWTGEAACTLSMVRCAITIPACRKGTQALGRKLYTSHFTTITVQNTQNLKFAFLIFSTVLQSISSCNMGTVHGNNATLYPSILTLKNVSNAEISSTIIRVRENYLEMPASHVVISDPQGTWLFDQMICSQTNVTININHCLTSFANTFKCNFSAKFASSIFHHSALATRTGPSIDKTYNAVSIVFLKTIAFSIHLTLKGYAANTSSFVIMECNISKMLYSLPVFSIPEAQHDIALVSIVLWKVNFQCYHKPCNMLLYFRIWNKTTHSSGCSLVLPNITMSEVTAKNSVFSFKVLGPYSFDKRALYKGIGCNRGALFHVLAIHNCIFEGLVPVQHFFFLADRRGTIISVENMGRFLVTWTGTNKIWQNFGCGIVLKNSRIQNDGYTAIEGNTEGGMVLHSDCLVLLSNNSILQVQNNRDKSVFSAGLAIVGTLRRLIPASLQLWPKGDVCFFQFVDKQGRYIYSFEHHNFNASISVLYNRQWGSWQYATNNIWNGHFDACLLQTQDGTIPVTNYTLTQTFSTDLTKLQEEATLPYKICFCNSNYSTLMNSENTLLWDCQQEGTISAYPGQGKLYVGLLADFNRTANGIVTIVNAADYDNMRFEIANCTMISLHWLTKPGETEGIVVELTEYNGDSPIWYVSHTVRINIMECPIGLVQVDSDSAGCSCNAVLHDHSFFCSVTSSKFTYKSLNQGMWIGYYVDDNRSLAIGHHCPVFYCNNIIFQKGILLEELLDRKQCQQQRSGIMCSECAEGTSSVFGSFRCQKCSHGWTVLVLIFALAGVLIIALLFLFNFTILQGTIQGIVLYANTLGLLGDFYEDYGVKYLYIPIALMNFDLGFETCFFNGMNEFSKAFLQFAFPLYLFTLLIITITVVHKCGYRIFRFRFIARRAVPVLATIMLLTYTDLAGAVITGLRYTTIYNASSGERRVVWLYQPHLLYFRGPHLALGILSLAMALLYLIPFTFIMLFGDLLRRYIHKLWFSHFLDVLQGAFRWPFGFWAGLRLLLRMGLIAISITATRPVFAISTGLLFFALHLFQLCINPFRVVQYGDENYNAQVIRNKPLLRLKLKLLSIKPPTFDGLFLLNVAATSAVVLFSTSGGNDVIVKVLTSILLLLAILECAIILIWHTYKFFPVSDKVFDKMDSIKMTLKLAFTKLVQRCHRRPNEPDELDRHSSVPVLELRLLPPMEEDFLDSSASESETDEDTLQTVDCDGTSSYNRNTVRLKQQLSGMAGQLQESLLM